MRREYSFSGTERFNERFRSMLKVLGDETRDAFKENLHVLLLGGSYGRGEGAVLLSNGEERPFGDIDLIPILEGGEREARKKFERIARKNRESFGIEIDFAKEVLVRDLARMKPILLWNDLRTGSYKVIEGDERALAEAFRAGVSENVEAAEAARLLIARGIDLLRSLRISDTLENEPDPGYLIRSYWRCCLSFGDSLLIAFGKYAVGLEDKLPLFCALEESCPEVKALEAGQIFEKAIEIRRKTIKDPPRPTRGELEALAWKWGSIFLLEEKRRLNGLWKNLSEYSDFKGSREGRPYEAGGKMGNVLSGIWEGLFASRRAWEVLYPRLPVLLGLTGKPASGHEWSHSSEKFLMRLKRSWQTTPRY